VIKCQPYWITSLSSFTSILNNIWFARQASSVQNYCYALRKFFAFCCVFEGGVSLPVSALRAASYISFVKDNSGSRGAISVAWNALKWVHNFVPFLNRFNDPLEDKIIKCVVESALRSVQAKKNVKKPLSGNFVRSVLRSVNPLSLVDLRNSSIIALAYSLLLRHDEVSHISCLHLSKVSGGLKVFLPSSKTDVYRLGKSVFLSSGGESTPVYKLLFSYLEKANLCLGQDHFLFGPMVYASQLASASIGNKVLSYNSYRLILREKLILCGLNPQLYGFHSCRKGGATSLAPYVSQYELLTVGRWKDPRSLSHYVEISDQRKLGMSKDLLSR
jgi:hypothetical protein